MKHSLSAQQAQALLSCSENFKTKHVSFKYAVSSHAAIAFSIKKSMGSAVLRNQFKRQSRSILMGPLFKKNPISLLVRPISKITKKTSVAEDFNLLKKHITKKEELKN